MVAMATLPLHVRSTLKYLAITLIRTVNNEADFNAVQTLLPLLHIYQFVTQSNFLSQFQRQSSLAHVP